MCKKTGMHVIEMKDDPLETSRQVLASKILTELSAKIEQGAITPNEISELSFRAQGAGVSDGVISDAIFVSRRKQQGFSDIPMR